MGILKACSSFFPRLPVLVFISLGLLLFKCENAGNNLAGKMWVYRKSLGRPVPGHSFLSLSPVLLPVAGAIPCLFCQNILFQFSASCLPNSRHRQLDSVDVSKAALPAHYPSPCQSLSLPAPKQHKLIGLNPVINRLEKQLSMFVSLPKAALFGHSSPHLFSSPSVLPACSSIMPSPPFFYWLPASGRG